MLTYLLFALPGLLLALWASSRVRSAFHQYSQIGSYQGITGAQAAQMLLDGAGIHDVQIVRVPGSLTDHYNPLTNQLALSEDVVDSTSIAAIGVATHEAGHAIQHAVGYGPLWLRSVLVQPASIGASIAPWIIVIGAAMSSLAMVQLGLIFFGAMVAFQLVTLPVEFDASNRAKRLVVETGIISQHEREGVDRVLNAAALTYIAAAISGIMTLLYYVWMFFGRSSDE
jgi:hypothetical protein